MEYVDPHDMNSDLPINDYIDPHNMEKVDVNKLLKRQPNNNNNNGKFFQKAENNGLNQNHLKRIISLLLHNAHLNFNDDFYYTGHINLNIDTEDYDFLKQFTESTDQCDLTILDVISRLDKSIQKTTFEKYSGNILTWKSWLFEMLFNYETGLLTVLVLTLYVMYRLSKAKYTQWQIIKYLFVVAYIIDWFLTYMHLREEEEINNLIRMKQLGNVPPECQPDKMKWSQWLGHIIGVNTNCRDYNVILFRNVNYVISPMKVFVKQFANFTEILKHIGEAFGKLGYSLFSELPFGFNLFMFPIMLIMILIIVIIVLVLISETSVEFSNLIFKLKFEPKSIKQQQQRQQQQINFLKSSKSNLNHRQFIEDINDEEFKQIKDEGQEKANPKEVQKELGKEDLNKKQIEETNSVKVKTEAETQNNDDNADELLVL